MKEVEQVRCEYILKWNEFVRQTGGIVLTDPKFESCLLGMLWKLAADMNGHLHTVDITEEEPFIKFADKSLLNSDEDVQMTGSFINVCRYYSLNSEKVYRLEADLQKYDREVNTYVQDSETLLTDKFNVAPINFYAYNRKLSNNSKRIKLGYAIISWMRNNFEDIRRGLHRYSNWIKHSDNRNRFEVVGVDANQRKLYKPSRIMYKFSKDPKVGTYEDHLDLIQDDLKAEKEARIILEEMNPRTSMLVSPTIKTTPIAFTSNGKLEKERYPTGQTTSTVRKETEASQQSQPIETIPVETQREVLIPQEEIPKEKREEKYQYVTESKDLTPKMSKTYVVKDLNNYDQENINVRGSTIPVSSSNIQPFEGEKVERIGGYGSVEYSQNQSQNINVENIPRANSHIIKSSNPTNVIEKSYTSINQPSDYNNLQQEIDRLRKQNEELSMKLSRISTIPQESVINPLQKSTISASAEKCPVFIRHHIALRNWNLIHKKTINISDSSSKVLKCIEPAMDLDFIITGSANGRLTFWKFANFATLYEYKALNLGDAGISSLLYMNDSKTLLCGLKDGKLIKCDMNVFSCNIMAEFDSKSAVTGLVNPLNGVSIFAACGKKIFEVDYIHAGGTDMTSPIINSLDAHDLEVTSIAFNPTKEILCSAGKDKCVKVWNAISKECLGILQGHADAIKSICFAQTHDHLILCSVAKDSYITFWNLTDKNLTKSLKMSSLAEKVIYLNDKKSVMTVHKSGYFCLWDMEKNEVREMRIEEGEMSKLTQTFSSCCYCDDGHNIVITTKEGSLQFWNAK